MQNKIKYIEDISRKDFAESLKNNNQLKSYAEVFFCKSTTENLALYVKTDFNRVDFFGDRENTQKYIDFFQKYENYIQGGHDGQFDVSTILRLNYNNVAYITNGSLGFAYIDDNGKFSGFSINYFNETKWILNIIKHVDSDQRNTKINLFVQGDIKFCSEEPKIIDNIDNFFIKIKSIINSKVINLLLYKFINLSDGKLNLKELSYFKTQMTRFSKFENVDFYNKIAAGNAYHMIVYKEPTPRLSIEHMNAAHLQFLYNNQFSIMSQYVFIDDSKNFKVWLCEHKIFDVNPNIDHHTEHKIAYFYPAHTSDNAGLETSTIELNNYFDKLSKLLKQDYFCIIPITQRHRGHFVTLILTKESAIYYDPKKISSLAKPFMRNENRIIYDFINKFEIATITSDSDYPQKLFDFNNCGYYITAFNFNYINNLIYDNKEILPIETIKSIVTNHVVAAKTNKQINCYLDEELEPFKQYIAKHNQKDHHYDNNDILHKLAQEDLQKSQQSLEQEYIVDIDPAVKKEDKADDVTQMDKDLQNYYRQIGDIVEYLHRKYSKDPDNYKEVHTAAMQLLDTKKIIMDDLYNNKNVDKSKQSLLNAINSIEKIFNTHRRIAGKLLYLGKCIAGIILSLPTAGLINFNKKYRDVFFKPHDTASWKKLKKISSSLQNKIKIIELR